MFKHYFFLLFLSFCTTYSFSQVGNVPFVFGEVNRIGREIKRTSDIKKANKEREAQEETYFLTISEADGLMKEGKYTQAIDLYNQALTIQDGQYPRDQIAIANVQLALINQQGAYQLRIELADSLYQQLLLSEAYDAYTSALALQDEQYPRTQQSKIIVDQEHWTQVHISGLLISDVQKDSVSSRAFSTDSFSDFLKAGKYPSIEKSLVYSGVQTIDGIAVPANTRVVIYSKANFKGEVLLDITGPAIINNINLQKTPAATAIQTKVFIPHLNNNFPTAVRSFSSSNMNNWVKGSLEISVLN